MAQQLAKSCNRLVHAHSVQRLPGPCLGIGDHRFALSFSIRSMTDTLRHLLHSM